MILKSTPATIQVEFGDGDDPTDPGVVTIGIDRADGTELVAAGTATGGTGTDPRTFQLTTTHTAQVDRLTATWVSPTKGTVTTAEEIVGGFYVDLMTLRETRGLTAETKFADGTLDDARHWWADLVETYCKVSFIPRHRIETKRRSAGDRIVLDRPRPRQIFSASLSGTTLDTSTWVPLTDGEIVTSEGVPPSVDSGLLTVAYEHGHVGPDSELYEAGVTAMRAFLLSNRTGEPSRDLSVTTEFGTTRIAHPGAWRATPWPEVNAVLNRRIGDIAF